MTEEDFTLETGLRTDGLRPTRGLSLDLRLVTDPSGPEEKTEVRSDGRRGER